MGLVPKMGRTSISKVPLNWAHRVEFYVPIINSIWSNLKVAVFYWSTIVIMYRPATINGTFNGSYTNFEGTTELRSSSSIIWT